MIELWNGVGARSKLQENGSNMVGSVRLLETEDVSAVLIDREKTVAYKSMAEKVKNGEGKLGQPLRRRVGEL